MEAEGDKPKRIFVKIVSQYLKCPVCMEVFVKPRRLNCGHTFCKPCLKRLFGAHKNPQNSPACPVCRQTIDLTDVGYDLIAKTIIDELLVMCPVKGCPWRGECQHLESHYKLECRIKAHIGSHPVLLDSDESEENELTQKVKENTQKGQIIARVLSKNQYLGTKQLQPRRHVPSKQQIHSKKNKNHFSSRSLLRKVTVDFGTQTGI